MGEQWCRGLFDKLLAPERASRIVDAFQQHATLGIVHAEGHQQPLHYYWCANQASVAELATRIGIGPPRAEQDSFEIETG